MELSTVVIKVQSNDIQAWEELYNSTYKRVYYYAYELTRRSKADADDLTQTAYIKAYQSINTLKNPEKFMPWILAIVKNQHTNTVTRTKKAYSLNDEFYANTLKVDDNFLPDYMLEQDDTRKILRDLIYELPEEQRDCILFHFHYEMSIVDVATALNCSPNTVKSRMRYGKSRLKEKVLSLEKRDGIRLHSFVPLGLFFAKDMSFVTDQLTIPPFVAVEAAGTATVATTTAVKSGIFTTAKVKAVAAVTAAAVVTGGVAYVALHQEPEVPAVVVESQPIVEELPSPVIFADATIEEAVRLALEIHDY